MISIAAVDVNLYIDCRLVIGSRHYSCTEKCMGSGDRPRVLESRKLSGSFNLLKIAIHFFGDSASELAQFPTSAYNPSPPRSAYFRINGHSCKQRRSTEFFRRSFFFQSGIDSHCKMSLCKYQLGWCMTIIRCRVSSNHSSQQNFVLYCLYVIIKKT